MKKLIIPCLLLLVVGVVQAQGPTTRAVTQLSSITTGVTINSNSGVITTVSATTAGAAKSTFTVTNSSVEADSVVIVGVQNYAGTYTTNGLPVVTVNNVAAGSFDVNIINAHASNALSGVLKIGFSVR